MKKKGSHVGFVLSFVIFITFLIFIYTLVDPNIRIQKDKEAILESSKRNVENRISSNLTTISVNIDGGISESNLLLQNFFSEAGIGPNLFVLDEEGNEFSCYFSSSGLYLDRESSSNSFFRIYVSEEFENIESGTLSNSEVLQEGIGYDLGLAKKEEYIFESKISNLFEEHRNSYGNLKTELNIPSNVEVDFGFEYSNGTLIETTNKNISTNIYVAENSIKYVNKSASIEFGSLIIKIW